MRENRTSGSMSGVGKRDLTLYETIDYRVTLRLYCRKKRKRGEDRIE